jgi:acyl carrier protein
MSVEATIERFIVDQIMLGDQRTKLDPDQSLLDSGILDSLALLQLIGFIEEQYGIKIAEVDVVPDNFQTLNSIKRFLDTKAQPR